MSNCVEKKKISMSNSIIQTKGKVFGITIISFLVYMVTSMYTSYLE